MPACAANVVGEFSMQAPSQIAKAGASAIFRSLPRAQILQLSHNADMETGKNAGPNYLRAWREFRELSQEKLAELVGTTAGVISHLEAGERGLSAKWLRRLAPVLKTTPGHLLDHDPNNMPADVLDIWSAIADREKPRALRVLESFKTGTND